MRIKNLLLFVCIAGCFASCSKSDPVEQFDYEAQFRIDTALINKYVKDNKLVGQTDKYGIFRQVIEPGAGTIKYDNSAQLTVDYKGSLLNGTVFNDTKGTPVKFNYGMVIDGWQIGIAYIQKGGKIRLLIPSYYGYGNRANGPIPGNSVLDFTIILTDLTGNPQ